MYRGDKLDDFLALAETPPRKNPRLGVEFDHETIPGEFVGT